MQTLGRIRCNSSGLYGRWYRRLLRWGNRPVDRQLLQHVGAELHQKSTRAIRESNLGICGSLGAPQDRPERVHMNEKRGWKRWPTPTTTCRMPTKYGGMPSETLIFDEFDTYMIYIGYCSCMLLYGAATSTRIGSYVAVPVLCWSTADMLGLYILLRRRFLESKVAYRWHGSLSYLLPNRSGHSGLEAWRTCCRAALRTDRIHRAT